jgi:hypothetical protein
MPINRTRREALRRAAWQAYSQAIVEGRDQITLARKRSAHQNILEGDVDGPADDNGNDRGDNGPGGRNHRTREGVPQHGPHS